MDEVSTTFYFNKGSVRQQTVTYSPYNENFYAIYINGVSEFLASKDKVNKMLSETDALIK